MAEFLVPSSAYTRVDNSRAVEPVTYSQIDFRPRFVPDPDTVFLCHANGPDESDDFVDVSLGGVDSPHTITPVNGAEKDTAEFKFGGASLFTIRSNGEHIISPASPDFDHPADYAREIFVKFNGSLGTGDFDIINNLDGPGANGMRLYIIYTGSSHLLTLDEHNGSTTPFLRIQDAVDFATYGSGWLYLAHSRVENVRNLYVETNRVATGSSATTAGTGGDLSIGTANANPGFNWNGWIDEARLSKNNRSLTGATTLVPTQEFSEFKVV